jgi:hypothetical protein
VPSGYCQSREGKVDALPLELLKRAFTKGAKTLAGAEGYRVSKSAAPCCGPCNVSAKSNR